MDPTRSMPVASRETDIGIGASIGDPCSVKPTRRTGWICGSVADVSSAHELRRLGKRCRGREEKYKVGSSRAWLC